MKTIKRKDSNRVWVIALALAFLFFTPPLVAAQDAASEISSVETVFMQGIVRRVLPEKNVLSVKVSKGERTQIVLSPQTELIGVSSLTELQKGQRVKVWYNTYGETNNAVKVELLPDLGC